MRQSRKTLSSRKRAKKIAAVIALILIVFAVDLPVISMVGTSFKTNEAVYSSRSLFPRLGEWSLENYYGVLVKAGFGKYMVNSALISVVGTFLGVVISACAGYSLSRFRGIQNSIFSKLVYLLQMFPSMLLLIPTFVLMAGFGMVNHPGAVMVYYASANLAFNVIMVKGFFDSIPFELEEAAKVDGCSRLASFLRVILPISAPGIATIAIITFLNCWNEYTFASLLLRDTKLQTLTVGLTKFVQESTTNWGYLMAASSIALLPALLFLIVAQKYLVQGMTAGSVKG